MAHCRPCTSCCSSWTDRPPRLYYPSNKLLRYYGRTCAGKAFEEAPPFTALLAVFFSIVAVIIDQHLFKPVIGRITSRE
ncbi:hypothetical protein P4S72_20950 [Vibrio sp. PP-XX7]